MRIKNTLVALQLIACFLTAGCAGTRTFHEFVRAGDTVALAAGWQDNVFRDNIAVTISPADGSPDIVYGPNHDAIRTVINFYPDPISSMVVSDRIQQDITPGAKTYANVNTSNYTDNVRDWWETVVFIDLPADLPLGRTWVAVSDPSGEVSRSRLDIIGGVGSPNSFSAENLGGLGRQYLAALERASFHEVSFSGSTLPDAIQLELSHDSGIGNAYAVSPISGVSNLAWSDDGSTLRALITPAAGGQVRSISDFKFYVAGGLQNLTVANIQAFNASGDAVPGIVATVKFTQVVAKTQ